MAVQRVAPTENTSPVQFGYRPAVSRPPVAARRPELTIAEQIDHLPDDYRRALFCRAHAEAARHRYFAGRQQEIARVVELAAAGDPRFRAMTPAQLQVTARWRWSRSAEGQYLASLEGKFTGWAHLYLSFAEMEFLNRHGLPPR